MTPNTQKDRMPYTVPNYDLLFYIIQLYMPSIFFANLCPLYHFPKCLVLSLTFYAQYYERLGSIP